MPYGYSRTSSSATSIQEVLSKALGFTGIEHVGFREGRADIREIVALDNSEAETRCGAVSRSRAESTHSLSGIVDRLAGERSSVTRGMGWDDQSAVKRTTAFVERVVPEGANVPCCQPGGRCLLDLNGRVGFHFLSSREGWHAGCHPADDGAAIRQLEAMRARGAGWIVFPTTSFRWLDHYSAFHQHLAPTYTAVPGVEDVTVRLSPGRPRTIKDRGG